MSQTTLTRYHTSALLFSLILHIGLGCLFFLELPPKPTTSKLSSAIPVRLIPETQLPQRQQIVTAPKTTKQSQAAPPATRLLAETNNTVKKQQIKRGQPDAAPQIKPQAKTKQPKSPQAQPAPPQHRSAAPKQLNLRPQGLSNFGMLPPTDISSTKTTPKTNPKTTANSPTAPFSRPTGSGARFLGLTGSADYLPDLPDGDLTLLNTKAQKYAVFVQRVAIRVFSALRASGWQNLTRSDILNIDRNAVVRVTLNRQGQIETIQLATSSGSSNFDRSLRNASSAAKDPNPPKSAFGNQPTLAFEFHARTWSQVAQAGPRAAPREQRWLFLGTALY